MVCGSMKINKNRLFYFEKIFRCFFLFFFNILFAPPTLSFSLPRALQNTFSAKSTALFKLQYRVIQRILNNLCPNVAKLAAYKSGKLELRCSSCKIWSYQKHSQVSIRRARSRQFRSSRILKKVYVDKVAPGIIITQTTNHNFKYNFVYTTSTSRFISPHIGILIDF